VDGCWPRSTPGPTPLSAVPSRSRCSPTGCGRSWKTIPAPKSATPLGPHSLALAEAFLAPLAAGRPAPPTYCRGILLIYDYTLGFALGDRTTINEQRVQDTAARRQLQAFFRSWPADRFPALAALGEHVWANPAVRAWSSGSPGRSPRPGYSGDRAGLARVAAPHACERSS
jgi:hypothetical protein